MTYGQIKLAKVDKLAGFAAENIRKGEVGKFLTRALMSSDDEMFYKCIDGISKPLLNKASLNVGAIYQFLALLHDDLSATLHINDFPVNIEFKAKQSIEKDQLIRKNHIADVRRLVFPSISIKSSDNIIYCFKVGWKFGLFFDFHRAHSNESVLDTERLALDLGSLYRRLSFSDVYNTLASTNFFSKLLADGWFPFVELIGNDFEELCNIYQSEFEVESRTSVIIDRFDEKRVNFISGKWWAKPIFDEKRKIIEAGIRSYLQRDESGWIACLKTLLSEIEGIITLQRYGETGSYTPRSDKFLEFLKNKGQSQAGHDDSLMLPDFFIDYLKTYFSTFDVPTDKLDLSRNTAGHGIADAKKYTRARALQSILTLDQIYFFL